MPHKNYSDTKLVWFLLAIMVIFVDPSALARQKVAEGEYAIQEDSSPKAATRWVLYAGKSGGYELESEIQNLPPGMRLLQLEGLSNTLVPISIGYQLFTQGSQKPTVGLICEFPTATITCHAETKDGSATSSNPYKYHGSLLLVLEGLSAMDMPWLLDGALNQAITQGGALRLSTLTVFGGGAELLASILNEAKLQSVANPKTTLIIPSVHDAGKWNFSTETDNEFKFINTEMMDLGQKKVPTKHYVLSDPGEPMDLWVTGSGIVVKVNDVVLINYKQYRKLIPELKIEAPVGSQPAQK